MTISNLTNPLQRLLLLLTLSFCLCDSSFAEVVTLKATKLYGVRNSGGVWLDSADAAAQATMAIWCVSSRSECNSSVIGERYWLLL